MAPAEARVAVERHSGEWRSQVRSNEVWKRFVCAQGKRTSLPLEGDIFVGDFGAGGVAEIFSWGGCVIEVVAATAG